MSIFLKQSTVAPNRLTQVGRFLTTLVSVLSLLSLVWAGYWMIRMPYRGFSWTYTPPVFRVSDVDPNSQAAAKLVPGEQLLAINGDPNAPYSYSVGLSDVGDVWVLTLRSADGHVRTETITLETSLDVELLVDHLAPLLVSLAFWASGLIVIALSIRVGMERITAYLYFAFCQLIVFYIASGTVSIALPELGGRLLLVFGPALGAVAIDLHVRFPRAWPRWPALRLGIAVLYLVALVASSVAALTSDLAGFLPALVWSYAWLAFCLAVVIVILVLALFQRSGAKAAFQARLIILTAVLGFLPGLFLTLLPTAIRLPYDRLPVSVSFAFMILVPLGYTYAILRYRLISYEGTVSQALGYLIAIVILIGVLIVPLAILLATNFSLSPSAFVTSLLALTAALIVLFEPVRLRIQRMIDGIFDRPWTEFRTTLLRVDQTLSGTSDVATWATAVCSQFSSALDVTPFGLLYRAPRAESFRLAVHDPAGVTATLPRELKEGWPLTERLSASDRPVRRRELRLALESVDVAESERAWVTTQAFDLWWPIRSHGHLKAVLLIGSRSTTFATAELELLALASYQIGVALENAEFTSELEQLSRSALQTRDDERRRVSRELHDHIIQPLVGLNFSLATIRDVPQASDARRHISDLITSVRKISSELRPPALDEVGLGAAARGLVRTFMRTSGLEVRFAILPNDDIDVPEPIASTLYGALREAMANIQKHSRATRVSVLLEATPGDLLLVVHDDGVGFALPERLGQLATDERFGLLGMHERLTAIDGSLEIHTSPGQGTRLECRAPLPKA